MHVAFDTPRPQVNHTYLVRDIVATCIRLFSAMSQQQTQKTELLEQKIHRLSAERATHVQGQGAMGFAIAIVSFSVAITAPFAAQAWQSVIQMAAQQIPNASGIVTGLNQAKQGEIESQQQLAQTKRQDSAGGQANTADSKQQLWQLFQAAQAQHRAPASGG